MSLHLYHKFILSIFFSVLLTWVFINLTYSPHAKKHIHGIDVNSVSPLHRYLVDFWLCDLPPIHGVVRIYLYLGLLLTALSSIWARPPLGDSPLQAPQLFNFTLPAFFSSEGAMKLWPAGFLTLSKVTLVRNVTLLAWVCCILGVGGDLPPKVVGFGIVFLHGIVQGCIGTSHRWYVPVYTCLAAAWSNGNGELSLDKYLFDTFGEAYPFPPPNYQQDEASISISGLSRKLVLIAGISTLFFGAITKFMNGGLAWLDGKTLAYYVSSEENGRSMWLKNLFIDYPWFSFFLSIASIGLEAISIVAIFIPWTRPIILISAAGLHLGIWLTMWPNYFPQTWCYGIGLAWVYSGYGYVTNQGIEENMIPSLDKFLALGENHPSVLAAIWISTFLSFFLVFVALFRIEYWPVTGIPMYSFYRDLSFSYKHLRDVKQAQLVAKEHMDSGYPNALAWSNLWIILRLKNTDPVVLEERKKRKAAQANGDASANNTEAKKDYESSEREFVNLKSRACPEKGLKKMRIYTTDSSLSESQVRGVLTKQWRRTLHNIAAADISAKPDDQIAHIDASSCGFDYPGVVWLKEQVAILREYAEENKWALPDWALKTGELQLRVKLADGYVVISKIPWNYGLDNHTTQPEQVKSPAKKAPSTPIKSPIKASPVENQEVPVSNVVEDHKDLAKQEDEEEEPVVETKKKVRARKTAKKEEEEKQSPPAKDSDDEDEVPIRVSTRSRSRSRAPSNKAVAKKTGTSASSRSRSRSKSVSTKAKKESSSPKAASRRRSKKVE